MTWETILILIVSTLGLVLIGYVALTTLFRALSRPSLLLPWKRSQKIAELEEKGSELLRMPLSRDDRHAVERALNTLRIPGVRNLSGPWSQSDPIQDAEQDIQSVWTRVVQSET